MMDSLKRWGGSALALGAALQLSGCLFVADDGDDGFEPLPLGTLTVNWSIDGLSDPIDCEDFGVDRLELVIFDLAGDEVAELSPFCESFGVSVDLPEGSYFADVTLVDSFDRAATLTETLDALDIIGGTELAVGVDFPIDSFL